MKLDANSRQMLAIMSCHGDYIESLFSAVFLASGYTKEDILSNSRVRTIVWSRMVLAHKLEDRICNLSAIGAILNRDHATVIHWRQMFEDMYMIDAQFKQLYDRFETIYSQQ